MPKTPPKNNGKTQKMTRNNSVKEAAEILKGIRSQFNGKGPQMANVNRFASILQTHGTASAEADDFIKKFKEAKGKLTNTSKSAKAAAPVSISLKNVATAMKEAAAPGAGAAAASSAPAKKPMNPIKAQMADLKAQLAALQTQAKEQRAMAAAEKKLKEEFAHLEEQAAKNLQGMEIDEHNVKRLAHIRGLGVGLTGANFIKVKKAFSRKYMTKKAKAASAAKASNGNAKPGSTRKNNGNGNAKSAAKANSARSESSNEGSNVNLEE